MEGIEAVNAACLRKLGVETITVPPLGVRNHFFVPEVSKDSPNLKRGKLSGEFKRQGGSWPQSQGPRTS